MFYFYLIYLLLLLFVVCLFVCLSSWAKCIRMLTNSGHPNVLNNYYLLRKNKTFSDCECSFEYQPFLFLCLKYGIVLIFGRLYNFNIDI